MDAVEHRGRNDKCTVGIVSCRTDVIPFFIKRGYKESILYVKSIYSVYSSTYHILHLGSGANLINLLGTYLGA